jgi:hypothetical protein
VERYTLNTGICPAATGYVKIVDEVIGTWETSPSEATFHRGDDVLLGELGHRHSVARSVAQT